MGNPRTSFTRHSILERLDATVAKGEPIVAAGSSVGIVAKAAEAGGADLIIVYSTGKSRIMGLPTTPMGHSNPTTLSMFREIENVVDDTPIIGGAEAADPTYRRLPRLLDDFQNAGFNGIINFPSVGVDPNRARMRSHIGQGLEREAEMVALARERDIFTMAYSYTADQARLMASAGVDVQVPHAGWTVGGPDGRSDRDTSLERSAEHVQQLIQITMEENAECICLAHGGAFATPEDTAYLYQNTDAVGFVGASSIERIPIEQAVADTVREFKSYRLGNKG